jgi:hypothetical protein
MCALVKMIIFFQIEGEKNKYCSRGSNFVCPEGKKQMSRNFYHILLMTSPVYARNMSSIEASVIEQVLME